jgi:hypothetical protein
MVDIKINITEFFLYIVRNFEKNLILFKNILK